MIVVHLISHLSITFLPPLSLLSWLHTQAGKSLIKSSTSLLTSAKSLVVNPNDPPMWQLLASHTKAVTDAIRNLLMAIRDKCPGQSECDDGIDQLNSTITQLDQAILAAMSQQLQPHASSTLQVGGERR